jgi:hypothetical protein
VLVLTAWYLVGALVCKSSIQNTAGPIAAARGGVLLYVEPKDCYRLYPALHTMFSFLPDLHRDLLIALDRYSCACAGTDILPRSVKDLCQKWNLESASAANYAQPFTVLQHAAACALQHAELLLHFPRGVSSSARTYRS